MEMTRILDSVNSYVAANGNRCYSFSFADTVDPGNYRVRLFFRYDGVNDLSSVTRTGLYAVSDNPCDTVSYDDWNGFFRHPFYDTDASTTQSRHDSSFNTEVCCCFSGDTPVHTLELFDSDGNPAAIRGESFLDGFYPGDNLPVGILLERRHSSITIKSARFDPVSAEVTVVTAGNHGYSDGDSITISGFPSTDHSCGVDGERYNGTYRIKVISPDTFTYATRFYAIGGNPCYLYDNLPYIVSSKWIVCEYTVERRIMCGCREALVAWPVHTFQVNDRVTLCKDGKPRVFNAVVESVAPNSFVCRSGEIDIMSAFDSVIYAPRTPVSDIPANYTAPAVVTKRRGGLGSQPTFVDNSSTTENRPREIYPVRYGTFDLDSDHGGAATDGELVISARKFGVVTFIPPASTDTRRNNGFVISVLVNGSSEVLTEICMSQLTDSYWNVASDAEEVFGKISKSPLGKIEVKSDKCEHGDTGCPQTCNYENPVRFNIDIPPSIGNKWVSAGKPVSLGFTLYGRTGSEVRLGLPRLDEPGGEPNDSFKIELTSALTREESLVPIKVYPDFLVVGELITVDTLNSKIFDSLAGNTRIRLRTNDLPDKWVPVYTISDTEITFFMPDKYNGKVQLTVMTKGADEEWDAGTATPCSETVQLTAYYATPKIVKLNDRLNPGEVAETVSRSASYNRDFAFTGFTEITDENSLIQNLYACLLTRKGERLFNPDFGTTIEERVFSLRDGGNPDTILKECIAAIQNYEPRIHLVYERCNIQDMGPHGICLTLGVIVPAGEVREITLPFKTRGRLV